MIFGVMLMVLLVLALAALILLGSVLLSAIVIGAMVGTPAQLVAWAVFLLAQNASFTFVSRARNSGSYWLHAVAAVCSNGIWITAQFVSLSLILDTVKSGTWPQRIFVAVFYTTFTVAGSVFMHWFGQRFIERGKRKVGA